MEAQWLTAIVTVAVTAFVLRRNERSARRDPEELDPRDARFGRPLERQQSIRFTRAFRVWAWIGGVLGLIGSVCILTLQPPILAIDVGLTLIATGTLVWVIGAGVGITRAFDRHDPE